MTAKEMDAMVKEVRKHHATINCRLDFENYAYYLYRGLKAIGRNELAEELEKLYDEMETIDTTELIKLGTFS